MLSDTPYAGSLGHKSVEMYTNEQLISKHSRAGTKRNETGMIQTISQTRHRLVERPKSPLHQHTHIHLGMIRMSTRCEVTFGKLHTVSKPLFQFRFVRAPGILRLCYYFPLTFRPEISLDLRSEQQDHFHARNRKTNYNPINRNNQ